MRNWIVLIALLLVGCDSRVDYVELKMTRKNPTSYVYNASLGVVKQTIKENHEQFPLKYIESADDSIIIWGKSILRLSENRNDFFIRNMLPTDTSHIYLGKKKSIPYLYSIHIHLKMIDSTRTLVELKTIDPKILLGIRFPYNILPKSLHSPYSTIIENVEPSTIEEYKVLLVIGGALDVKDEMPPLILPESMPRQ